MGYKLFLPTRPKPDLEMNAIEFCGEIRKNKPTLEFATCYPNKCQKARTMIHLLRDKYHRGRGEEFGGRLIQLSDCVDQKVSEIVNLNPGDWNNYRRGQQFRRLEEWLLEFETERFHPRRIAEPTTNVETSRGS